MRILSQFICHEACKSALIDRTSHQPYSRLLASAAACSKAVVPHFLARAHCPNCCVGETNISHGGFWSVSGMEGSDHVDSLPHQMTDRKFQNCADSLPIPLCACVDECPRARATLPTSRHCKGGDRCTAAALPPLPTVTTPTHLRLFIPSLL